MDQLMDQRGQETAVEGIGAGESESRLRRCSQLSDSLSAIVLRSLRLYYFVGFTAFRKAPRPRRLVRPVRMSGCLGVGARVPVPEVAGVGGEWRGGARPRDGGVSGADRRTRCS